MPARSFTLERVAAFTWRALVVAVGVYLVALVAGRLLLVVLPVIIALLITTILQPVVDALDRRGLPRMVATWLVLLVSIGAVVGLAFALAPSISSEFSDLGETLDEGRQQVEEFLADGPFGIETANVDDYLDRLGQEVSGSGSEIASGVVAGAVVAFEVVAGFLLLIVLLFFFLKDGDKFTSFGLRQIRSEHHELASALGLRAWNAAGGYVRGTAIVALADATIIGVGLLIIGVPLVLPLAILTFFGAFFPLVGATVAGVVAALVALVDGGFDQALLVVGLIVIVQQVEGDLLAPLVLGRAVKLHPVVILVVLTAGAVLGGLVGAFLAVPVTAVIVAIGTELGERGIIGPGDRAGTQEQSVTEAT